MRLKIVVLAVILFIPCNAWAGLYNPCEPDEGPFMVEFYNPDMNRGFLTVLTKYRSCGADPAKLKLRDAFLQRYLLAEKSFSGDTAGLNAVQKLSLSEYLIRRGRYDSAVGLLRSLAPEAGDNFMVYANLATACFHMSEGKKAPERKDRLFEAIENQKEALRMWPATFDKLAADSAQKRLLEDMHWTPEETFPRCRVAEEYLLKLLKNRLLEARLGKTDFDSVDPLFTDTKNQPLRYGDADGKFVPGQLAKAERAKLPDFVANKPQASVDKAIGIVQQLLVWLPYDDRLYWQLGELYSARGTPGDLHAAWRIFNELIEPNASEIGWTRNLDIPVLRERRAALARYSSPPPTNPITLQQSSGIATVDWRLVGVSFGLGVIVTVLVQWQYREIVRRRHRV